MKILPDENIDIRFKKLFPVGSHEVYTVRDMGWNGIRNGALLKLLEEQFCIFKNLHELCVRMYGSCALCDFL